MADVESTRETALAPHQAWVAHNWSLLGGPLTIGSNASTTRARSNNNLAVPFQGVLHGPASSPWLFHITCLKASCFLGLRAAGGVAKDVNDCGFGMAKAHPSVSKERGVNVRA